MKSIIRDKQFEIEPCAVVFGNFDGVHKGHQLLIGEAVKQGKALGIPTAVFTFKPHPTYVVMGKEEKDIVFTPEEKINVMRELGVDYYIEYPFNMDVAKIPAQDFVEEVIFKQIHAKIVIVGEDFRFGSRRSGDVALLKSLGEKYGYDVIAFKKLCDTERCISSTWLREVIKSGKMETFNELTGRNFPVVGVVEHGQSIGRTIGFPTANINIIQSKLLPPNGVYASYTYVKGVKYKSITNVGKKPKSESDEMVVETFILDFDEMIYGETIEINMAHYMRKELVLESLDHLKSLIKKDLVDLYAYFDSIES